MGSHGRRCNLEIHSRSCTGVCAGRIEVPPTTGPRRRKGWLLREGVDYSLFQQGQMAISSGSALARLLLIYSLCSEVLGSRFTVMPEKSGFGQRLIGADMLKEPRAYYGLAPSPSCLKRVSSTMRPRSLGTSFSMTGCRRIIDASTKGSMAQG